MRFVTNFFIGVFVVLLGQSVANAEKLLCPTGCFCLDDGKFEKNSHAIFLLGGGHGASAEMIANDPEHYLDWSEKTKKHNQQRYDESVAEGVRQLKVGCKASANPLSPSDIYMCFSDGWLKSDKFGTEFNVICDREKYKKNYVADGEHVDYFLSDFTEFYTTKGYSMDEGIGFGAYGRKGNDILYLPYKSKSAVSSLNIFQCPINYPLSNSGAKTLYECYKYDAKGNKVYYKAERLNNAKKKAHCLENTYLPANATECVKCDVSKNQICPSEVKWYEQSDIIQGLKIKCDIGQYLPANSQKCANCDGGYLCFGGEYDVGRQDQGRLQKDGYIPVGNHNVMICKPGEYMPARADKNFADKCQPCPSNKYVCPGGVFYTDVMYNFDRGLVLCDNGKSKSTLMACIVNKSLYSTRESIPRLNDGVIANAVANIDSGEQDSKNAVEVSSIDADVVSGSVKLQKRMSTKGVLRGKK